MLAADTQMSALRSLSVVVVAVLVCVRPISGDKGSGLCMDDLFGGNATCIQFNVNIVDIHVMGAPATCQLGETTTLHMAADLLCQPSIRFGIAIVVALDGGAGFTGTCSNWDLAPVSATNLDLNLTGGVGPFRNEPTGTIDVCGDMRSSDGITTVDLGNVTFLCKDENTDGFADISGGVGWENAAPNGGTRPYCLGPDQAGPTRKQRCRFDIFNMTSIVCLANVTINDVWADTEYETPVLIDVLAGDDFPVYGPDYDSLVVITNATNGTTVVHGNGTITYTPNAGFSGNDTFVYFVCNNCGTHSCGNATVYITVGLPPTTTAPTTTAPTTTAPPTTAPPTTAPPTTPAANASLSDGAAITPFETPVDVDLLDLNTVEVFGPPVNDSCFVYFVGDDDSPANGNVTVNATGIAVYVPDNGFSGIDFYPYTMCYLCNPELICGNATVAILTQPPLSDLVNILLFAAVGTSVSTDLVDANADDPNYGTGVNATCLLFFVNITLPPEDGDSSVNATGVTTYTPDPAFTALDVYSYTICNICVEPFPDKCANASVFILMEAFENATTTAPPATTTAPPATTAPVLVVVNYTLWWLAMLAVLGALLCLCWCGHQHHPRHHHDWFDARDDVVYTTYVSGGVDSVEYTARYLARVHGAAAPGYSAVSQYPFEVTLDGNGNAAVVNLKRAGGQITVLPNTKYALHVHNPSGAPFYVHPSTGRLSAGVPRRLIARGIVPFNTTGLRVGDTLTMVDAATGGILLAMAVTNRDAATTGTYGTHNRRGTFSLKVVI